ncbi:hypothetical protein HZI73_25545 [Vallitalea pronyensis]|uniref:Uncharacterized protein n=1 Tax=Vallitalea pronyensis TaxID=1348613 RepID=A0A8J8SJF1_9FIRM|nr:hypothetical protein [Vallitalea pronyensis]QUI25454.1 hypothetical protein HZI73_25545 [Vallitalea pronyensis]
MKKIAFLLISLLSLTMIRPVYAQVSKHESIYIKLNHDGTMDHTTVVNRLHGSTDEAVIVDYGSYKSVKSLMDDTVGLIEGNRITWPADVLTKDFYYEGELEDIQLPHGYHITYYLNDEPIQASQLAGKSGQFMLKISVDKNKGYQADMDFSTQIQVALDLDKFSDVRMNSGNVVTVGKTLTVNYMLLPDQTGEFILEAVVQNLELSPIIMTLVPFDMTVPGDIQEGIDGIGDMADGSNELVEKTTDLQEGIQSVTDAVYDLSKGAKGLMTGAEQVEEGLQEATEGITSFQDQSTQMVTSVHELVTGIGSAQASVEQLTGGYSSIKENMDNLLEGKEQTLALAQNMIASGVEDNINLGHQLIAQMEAYTQMAISMEQLNAGLHTYVAGINKVETGMKAYHQQVSQLPSQVGQLTTGLQHLHGGTHDLSKGIKALHKGASQLNQQTKELPSHMHQLQDGQKELHSGIATIHEKVNAYESLTAREGTRSSFVDLGNPIETNTQLIIQTPPIRLEKKEIIPHVAEEKKTFWDRVLDLFR